VKERISRDYKISRNKAGRQRYDGDSRFEAKEEMVAEDRVEWSGRNKGGKGTAWLWEFAIIDNSVCEV